MPYEQYLKRFPAYLQQLTMESNGKHVTLDGRHVDYETGAIFWGEPGTNGQHSFYQLIHQGTKLIPVDLIGFAKTLNPLRDHHDLLIVERVRPGRGAGLRQDRGGGPGRGHGRARRPAPGVRGQPARPTSILAEELTPHTLGSLVALYEHSVFTQGVDLGDRLVRPVGRRAGQGARGRGSSPSSRARPSPTCTTTARRTR